MIEKDNNIKNGFFKKYYDDGQLKERIRVASESNITFRYRN
jgi:hypothetical protein